MPLSLFPPTSWWASALQEKGPLRLFTGILNNGTALYNRYRIVTANGPQNLSVPLKGGRKQRIPLSDLKIDYTHDWQRQHWGALYSAYGRAPYFEHYGPALEALIYKGHEGLKELSRAAIEWLSREMRIPTSFSEANTAHQEVVTEKIGLPVYHQVFEERWGFLPALSAIDLLMNEGPYASQFLTVPFQINQNI